MEIKQRKGEESSIEHTWTPHESLGRSWASWTSGFLDVCDLQFFILRSYHCKTQRLEFVSYKMSQYFSSTSSTSSSTTNKIQLRRKFIQRNREAEDARLFNDYLSTNSVYPNPIFEDEFECEESLYIRIVNAFESCSSYFQPRGDVVRRKDLSPLKKITNMIRQLAYGVTVDHLDEDLRMGQSTFIKCLHKFCCYVVELFGDRYLRRLNIVDVQRLLQMHERDDFPCMLDNLDCMH